MIPARNEADSIGRCLEHVLAQDIGLDRLEVIVVDGDSTDGTGEIAAAILERAGLDRWVVHCNKGGSTPSNLNAGLALVRAPVVCRVDARSMVPPRYVRACIETLQSRPDVAVVGGAQVAVPRSESNRDQGIARALNNRYGMGLSRYRRGARSGRADTVYLGAFRTAELRGVGGWDERLPTNQDFDLNRRIAHHGHVWFESSLEVGYSPRSSVRQLWMQYHRFGRWKVRYWRMTGDRPQQRQMGIIVAPVLMLIAAIAFLVPRSGRMCRMSVLTVGTLGAAVALEELGSQEGTAGTVERGWAIAGMVAVGSGWLSGVLRDAVFE
nr:glycosyltransferase [Rhabdothermincola salaria]